MNAKHVNRNSIRLAQAATGISPADFPIGSLESRAAARVLLEKAGRTKPRLSEYEEDALTIYRHAQLLGRNVCPIFGDVAETAVYRRGQELAKRPSEVSADEINAADDGIDWMEQTINNAFGRAGLPRLAYPPAIRKQAVLFTAHRALLLIFQQAWERQLPELSFPIKTEIEGNDGRLYLRQTSGAWLEEKDEGVRRTILGPIKEIKQLLEKSSVIDEEKGIGES